MPALKLMEKLQEMRQAMVPAKKIAEASRKTTAVLALAELRAMQHQNSQEIRLLTGLVKAVWIARHPKAQGWAQEFAHQLVQKGVATRYRSTPWHRETANAKTMLAIPAAERFRLAWAMEYLWLRAMAIVQGYLIPEMAMAQEASGKVWASAGYREMRKKQVLLMRSGILR